MGNDKKSIINSNVQKIVDNYNLDEGKYAASDPDAYVKDRIEKFMESYADNEINYVVDKATITCSQRSDKQVILIQKKKETEIKGEGGTIVVKKRNKVKEEVEEIYEAHMKNEMVAKLFATSSCKSDSNGLKYATVIDTKSKYAIDHGEKEGEANIVSMGNCKIILNEDLDKIIENKEQAKKYGLCYCLMDLADKWINPICVSSSISDIFETNPILTLPSSYIYNVPPIKSGSNPNHVKTMEWAVKGGKEEGLTMLSTLLCNRGGIISIEFSGQIFLLQLSELLDLSEEDILLMGEKEFLKYINDLKNIVNQFKITGELEELINKRMEFVNEVKGIVMYISDDTFIRLGWNKSDYEGAYGIDFIEQLRKCMLRDGITNVNSIAMFLSNIGAESGDGTVILEDGDEAYFNGYGYTTNTKGFGIIQVSVENQELFVKYLLKNENDQDKLESLEKYLNGYTTIKQLYSNNVIIDGKSASEFLGENYPIDSATWFWSINEIFSAQGPDVKTIDDYISKNKKGIGEDDLFDKSIGFVNIGRLGEQERKDDWEEMKKIIDEKNIKQNTDLFNN